MDSDQSKETRQDAHHNFLNSYREMEKLSDEESQLAASTPTECPSRNENIASNEALQTQEPEMGCLAGVQNLLISVIYIMVLLTVLQFLMKVDWWLWCSIWTPRSRMLY
jgi:hypothetical protein